MPGDAPSSAADAASLATPVGAAVAVGQGVLGLVQSLTADAKIKKILAQRKAYQTPEEIFKILQASENKASSGYDPQTLDYLTSQTDRALGAATNTASLLGADPNDLSAIFDQKIQATMKIGAENHLENLKNFDKYISALGLVADNRAAEQKSQQDLLKDQLQAASLNKAAGGQNIAGGINTALSTLSSAATMDLYKQQLAANNQNITNSVDPSYYIDVYNKLQKPRVYNPELGVYE